MSNQDYRHVTLPVLRHTLESDPANVSPARLDMALTTTAACIVRDQADDTVPARAVADRMEAHRRAERAAARQNIPAAIEALRDCWGEPRALRRVQGPVR